MKSRLLIIAALLAGLSASAQSFKPLETWPYLYEDFTEGGAITFNDDVVKYDRMNINLIDGKLHYIQNGTIMVADLLKIKYVTIEADVYANVMGRLMKVLRETPHGGVLLDRTVNAEEMKKASIGYGKSAVASTQHVSSMALEAPNDFNTGVVGRSLDDFNTDKYSGNELPVKETRYLSVDGYTVRAAKKEVMAFPGIDANALKSYLKAGKVKFNNVEDLASLVEFLHSNGNTRQ